jgi:DNA-binding XRE family transcriptional regulator
MLRKELNLPPTPVLIITQNAISKGSSKSLGEQLREHRAASRLLMNQAARELGVSATSLGAWESNKAFPSVCWNSNRTGDCSFDAHELKTAVGPFYAPRHSGGSRVKWQHR